MTTAQEVLGSMADVAHAMTVEKENRLRAANMLRDVAGWVERGFIDSIAFEWKNSAEIDFRTSSEEQPK
jgi:hypothetical protein